MPVAAKCLIGVLVGLSGDMLIPERCRSWSYNSDDYENDRDLALADMRFTQLCDEASKYAREQMHPSKNNFVQMTWVWV